MIRAYRDIPYTASRGIIAASAIAPCVCRRDRPDHMKMWTFTAFIARRQPQPP
ncbi:hypothetical protein BIFANG_03388 [Bifidobacterium angulatum DSM 20098 = JCM 7096]|uniref:Uncharacterized protein n=1 Tax=Bifidobacterium angulatum DSM 20098 = JCM 7096 TaxID=518635 RepID=C4FGC0_9BIFI|nr:hypothetical protein BIFANG_03388 [Bifidobacterium angulatum DSM 20098 = JCM 7096]